MSPFLLAIVAAAVGGIIAGIALKILTETDWIGGLSRLHKAIIETFSFIVAVLTILGVGITITPPLDWEVTGRIIDRYAQVAIPDARVTIERLSAQTGNEGSFLIEYNGTPQSRVEIRVEKDGYVPWRAYVPINTPTIIELAPQEPHNPVVEEGLR